MMTGVDRHAEKVSASLIRIIYKKRFQIYPSFPCPSPIKGRRELIWPVLSSPRPCVGEGAEGVREKKEKQYVKNWIKKYE
jgi:hypothetical protein